MNRAETLFTMTTKQAMQHLISSGKQLKNRMVKIRFQNKAMTSEQMRKLLEDNKYIVIQEEQWGVPDTKNH